MTRVPSCLRARVCFSGGLGLSGALRCYHFGCEWAVPPGRCSVCPLPAVEKPRTSGGWSSVSGGLSGPVAGIPPLTALRFYREEYCPVAPVTLSPSCRDCHTVVRTFGTRLNRDESPGGLAGLWDNRTNDPPSSTLPASGAGNYWSLRAWGRPCVPNGLRQQRPSCVLGIR